MMSPGRASKGTDSMYDLAGWVAGTSRDVERRLVSGSERYAVILRRQYGVLAEEVWDACTSAARLAEWFLPISGELRLGGRYQFEGNAGGQILDCDRPRLVRVSWEYGDNPAQQLTLQVSQQPGAGAAVQLEHAGPAELAGVPEFAFGVGPGWDPALIALGTYLDADMPDKSWWLESPEARELIERSVRAWQQVLNDREIATPAVIAKAAETSLAFYTGTEPPPES